MAEKSETQSAVDETQRDELDPSRNSFPIKASQELSALRSARTFIISCRAEAKGIDENRYQYCDEILALLDNALEAAAPLDPSRNRFPIETPAPPAHAMGSDHLLPCPFCGGKAEFHDTSSTWVRCEDCGAEIQCQIDKKDALIAWNRRAAEPVAWLRYGEAVPVQNVPWGAMWISDKNDPRAFPVYRCQHSPIDVSEDMLDAYGRAKEIAEANIQGFYEEELGHHYVMDLRKPSGSQIIWEVKYITNAGYDAGHGAMLKALNRFVAIEAVGAALAGRAS